MNEFGTEFSPMSAISFEYVLSLHNALHSRFRKYNIDLQSVTGGESAACVSGSGTKTVQYLRVNSAAQTVEAMMGRDIPGRRLEARRHPVIEMRPVANGLTLELIIAPHAWWDQQNLVAKLSVESHHQSFHKLIARLNQHYCLGFWEGTNQDDMSLTAQQLKHPAACKQWMSTFCDGQDWLRIGMWYSTEEVQSEDFIAEAFRRIQELYEIYKFVAWTGNNDFRTLQRKNAVCYV
jgi:hypothetical protein